MSDDADYMSTAELVEWLSAFAPPKAARAAQRLAEGIEAASKEVIRLQLIIEEHTKRLSAPIASQYAADLKIELNPHLLNTVTRIKLSPILHEIRVPFLINEWTDDFKHAFFDQVATEIGHVAGKRLAKELWPTSPSPAKSQSLHPK